MQTFRTRSAEGLKKLAADLLRTIAPRRGGATIVALSGELGAGKTTFTQGIAAALGVEGTVSSPTFVLEKRYPLSGQLWQQLVHIDAYRLGGAQELKPLEWDRIVADRGNLIFLEWPERIEEAVPPGAVRVHFNIEGDGRIITINGNESGEKEGGQERNG